MDPEPQKYLERKSVNLTKLEGVEGTVLVSLSQLTMIEETTYAGKNGTITPCLRLTLGMHWLLIKDTMDNFLTNTLEMK